MQLNRNALAYSATTLAATMMNSIFQFYYVKIFLNVYRISNYWFNVAQIVFLIWNAVNDPLFGYFQDSSTWMFLRKRRLAIFYGAPLFAISFLTPWFPWTWFGFSEDWAVGLHLMTALCFFDGMFTFVVLAQCALFAEISTEQEERQTTLKYSQVASIIGTTALLVSTNVYQNEQSNFQLFQAVCVIVAFLSWLLMRYTGMNVQVAVEASTTSSTQNEDGKTSKDSVPLFTLLKQILTQRSFGAAFSSIGALLSTKFYQYFLWYEFTPLWLYHSVCFVTMNFFQVFHTTFCSNFFLIFAENLIGPDVIPAILYSLLTGSVFLLPRLLVLLTSPLLTKFGSYKVILWSFYLKVSLPAIVYFAGRNNIWILYFFLIIDNSLPDATFSLFNLSVSDIIDHDMEKYQRNAPVSSMIFGTNALFTKPAQSLAPMMVVHILSWYGYKETLGANKDKASSGASPQLLDTMFFLLCLIPLVIAVVQIVFWKLYPLKRPKKAPDGSKILA